MQMIAIAVLAAVAAGGVIWVFVYPILSGERKAEKRQQSITRSEPAARTAAVTRGSPKARREQVEDTLKELELRQKKAKNLPLPIRISQAGLSWSKRQFIILSVACGVALFAATFFAGGGLFIAAGLGFAAG
ncbi:MAG: tight adherence protein, partial [Hyphomicrobiales bacterium]|nr:tight adherence protein [Hyphomicrobiales bacterium]